MKSSAKLGIRIMLRPTSKIWIRIPSVKWRTNLNRKRYEGGTLPERMNGLQDHLHHISSHRNEGRHSLGGETHSSPAVRLSHCRRRKEKAVGLIDGILLRSRLNPTFDVIHLSVYTCQECFHVRHEDMVIATRLLGLGGLSNNIS